MRTHADLVLRGAPVYRHGRWDGDCLAVRGGRIVAIGSSEDVAPLVSGGTEVRDMSGRWLLPGFHDAHVHPVQAGREMHQCDLSGTTEVAEYLRRVQRYAEAHPGRSWICGGGWSMDSFPGGVPTAGLLDRVCPDRPVYLPNRDHHSAWVNSRALDLAGIDARTPDPADGRIERLQDGSPSGTLHEGAMGLVARLVPEPTADELLEALLTAQTHLHSLGVVGWQDALVGTGLGMADSLPTYVEAQEAGLLSAKVVLALWWDRERGLRQVPELLERRRIAAQAGLRATTVKIMQDGVCETRTAAMLQPYLDDAGRATDNRGLAFLGARDLAAAFAALEAVGFQVHVHALGDRAVRDSLDAAKHAAVINGSRGARHHLAHLQVVAADDVARFADLDVTATVQPLWACHEDVMDVLTLPFLPEGARQQQYVFASLRRAGARLAFGSDWPISSPDPLQGVHVAVNRRPPGDERVAPLLPDEVLTVTQAIDAYTASSAWVNHLETSSGTLEVGYAADVAVIDADVLALAPSAIGDVAVTDTFVDGRHVHGG
jgi:predicted amidohydrolase YtcJ